MIVLALDTSTPRGSVAVFAFGEMVCEEQFTAARSHSSSLFAALEKARASAARFDRIAVGLGPGSYAGIRIGIAAALGLNLGLGTELLGLASVTALDTTADDFVVIGDARRDAFYFTHVAHGQCADGPRLADEREVRELIDALNLPVLATEPLATFPSAEIVSPSAGVLARLAAADRGILQRDRLDPLYLRAPHITQPKVR
jgi:tRNA threonylcarbamoyl adenosine modification protein YeaZ